MLGCRLADFEVDETIVRMLVKVVLVDGGLREDVYGNFHVFKAGHWCSKVEVLDVKAHISGIFCADTVAWWL